MITPTCYWFTDDRMTVILGDKPSLDADFTIHTSIKANTPIKQPVSSIDFEKMGYQYLSDIRDDVNAIKIISEYAKKKFN